MKKLLSSLLASLLPFFASAQLPDNLVAESVPGIPPELRRDVARYLEFRAAAFQSWHPIRREMLITTRFADTPQLHLVKAPGGVRKQITFGTEPVSSGKFRPKAGDFAVFSQDSGGGEFHQLYRHDFHDGRNTLLTDGKSRNTGGRFSNSGIHFAYTSTRRTGKDNDIWVMIPSDPKTDHLLTELSGGGWGVLDWSPDDNLLLVLQYISINESHLHIVDARTGKRSQLTRAGKDKVAYGHARFTRDGKAILATSDDDSEFQQLIRIDLKSGEQTTLSASITWDVEEFEESPDGKVIAFVTNEAGVGALNLMDAKKGKALPKPKLPLGTVSNLDWHANGHDLAFNLSSAKSPSDVYSLDLRTGLLERWTESETGGLNPSSFVEPEILKLSSFDGLLISAIIYRPDPRKFPGPRPAIISIHGGPEGQSRPGFQSRNNYLLNELGIALVYPNVRGSAGYGKTFLTLDNGFKREDSVRDIATIIGWIARQPDFNRSRIAVTGGSYGGYMSLACMVTYADVLRCGIDVVGISNFVTFLNNTQDYRRDLRRVEYGDERDPKMKEFLERISPANQAARIKKPLFVVQGKNDPRVPFTESEQMVKAIRDAGGKVWYLMAKDEGHGFAKKRNADIQFLATILFYKEHLLN
ncbi:MAG: S9 family peptidase [Verrucomicrobia bacterium]|nr:S9 family peptidase [Verrucomicrobiota bacterium]